MYTHCVEVQASGLLAFIFLYFLIKSYYVGLYMHAMSICTADCTYYYYY